jgi:hypothetical protein
MNKYLEKISKDSKDEYHPGYAVGAHVVGGIASTTLISPIHKLVSEKVMRAATSNVSDSGADLGTVKKFMRDNNLHKKVTFNTRAHVVNEHISEGLIGKIYKGFVRDNNNGPAYIHSPGAKKGAKKFIIGVKDGKKALNPDVIMHELGHAKDFSRHSTLKHIITSVGRNPLLIGGGTIAALSNEKTRDYAPAIAAIPGLTSLRNETVANYHAYHGIKAHKGAGAANKFLKRLLPSQMGSYAVGAVVPVAGAYLAKRLMENKFPKKHD